MNWCCSFFIIVKLLFPLSILCCLKGSCQDQPTPAEWPASLREGSLHKLFRIFRYGMNIYHFFLLMYSISHLHQCDLWIFILNFGLGSSSVTQTALALAPGSPFSWHLCPFNKPSSFCCISTYFLAIVNRLLLWIPCTSSRMNCFSKYPCIFSWEKVIRSQDPDSLHYQYEFILRKNKINQWLWIS